MTQLSFGIVSWHFFLEEKVKFQKSLEFLIVIIQGSYCGDYVLI